MSKYMSNCKPSGEITLDVSGMGDYYLLNIYEAVRDFADGGGGANDSALEAVEDWLISELPAMISDAEADAAGARRANDNKAEKEANGRANKMREVLEEIDARRSSPIADAVRDYLGNAANDVEIHIFENGAKFIDSANGDYWRGMFRAAADLAAVKIAPDVPEAENWEIVKAIFNHYGLPY